MDAKPTTEAILIEFSKAVKAVYLYPEGHPNLDTLLERGFTRLKEVLNQREKPITWTIDRNGFYEDRIPLCKGNKGIEVLAREVFLRRIKRITFSQNVTLPEWKALLKVLTLSPEVLKDEGGAERVFMDVEGIWVDEVHYEEIVRKATELKEDEKREGLDLEGKAKEKERIEELKKAPLIETTLEWLEKKIGAVQQKEETEETLEELLLALENESNNTAYDTLVNKIIEKGRPLKVERRWEELLPVLIAFASHSTLQPHRPEEQKETALRGLMELLTVDMIDYLIQKLSKPGKPDREAIQQILLRTGEMGMDRLISTLIITENIFLRRQVFNALVLFGEAVRVEAEKRLDDPRWFVVGQMVSLLGEIGNPQSIDGLKKAFQHPDVRVKREVLKAMAKMPSQDSLPILLEALVGGNKALRFQAVVSLGILKAPESTPHLMKIALKRGFIQDDVEIRKEAVKVLGVIGDRNATSTLIKLLKRRPLFKRKELNELRCLAAISLGKIGGDEGLRAIEEVAKRSRGILHHTCKMALERAGTDV